MDEVGSGELDSTRESPANAELLGEGCGDRETEEREPGEPG